MNYNSIFQETTEILAKYGLDNMLKGFTPDLIKLLMQNHIDKIKLANSYNVSRSLITASLCSQFGAPVDMDDFITDDLDRRKLYSLFAQWRVMLLAELGIQD